MKFPRNRKLLSPLLIPLSLLYGFGVAVRNKLFDLNILKSFEFDLPIISVGNITVGGTGKTPHIEYLVEMLNRRFKLAVLSRGYKRNTKGFILAGKDTDPDEIGDESYQVFSKYENISVAVDEKRVHGVKELKKNYKDLQVILLDDAFQHRYIKPGVSILLIDYHRPLNKDFLLPYGQLRECRDAIRRAHIVIVTKVPDSIKPIEMRLWKKELKLYPYQFMYFTKFTYGSLIPMDKGPEIYLSELKQRSTSLLLVTGIANPEPMVKYLTRFSNTLQTMQYPDHHNYTVKDCQIIKSNFDRLPGNQKIIVITEKDAVKLRLNSAYNPELKSKTCYLPVRVKFLNEKECDFDSNILNYVAKNKKINRLHK